MGCFFALIFLFSLPVRADPRSNRSMNDAVDTLVSFFVKNVKKNNHSFGRSAILVSVSDRLDPALAPYLSKQMESRMKGAVKAEVVPCFQCEAVRAYSDGNRIVVEKGLDSNDFATKTAQELSLDTFFLADLSYTGNKLNLQVKAIDTAKNEITWEKTYRVHSRFLTDRNFIISFDVGSAYILKATDTEDKFGLGISTMLGERFYGFGKIGLAFSTVFSVTHFTFNQATGPYVSVNINELSGMYWSWGTLSVFVNPAYAVSQKSIGVLARGGLQLDFGSFTHVTAEMQMPVYSQNSDKKYPTSGVLSVGFDIF